MHGLPAHSPRATVHFGGPTADDEHASFGASRVNIMGRVSGWLASLRWIRSAPQVEDDFADMGTAFGLDASLETVPSAYQPASGHPEAQAWPAPFDGALPSGR
jgi:hypothetical protein